MIKLISIVLAYLHRAGWLILYQDWKNPEREITLFCRDERGKQRIALIGICVGEGTSVEVTKVFWQRKVGENNEKRRQAASEIDTRSGGSFSSSRQARPSLSTAKRRNSRYEW